MSNRSKISVGCGTKRDHQSGQILAYVLASHEDTALMQLKRLLAPFFITHFYTDGWGAYQRLLEERASYSRQSQHSENRTQAFNIRTRIKRLAVKQSVFPSLSGCMTL